MAPADLARMARNAVEADAGGLAARYEARSLKMWWTPDKSMLHLHGEFTDVMGAKVEATIKRLTERRRPANGRAWDRFEHRAADAMVQMCDAVAVAEQVETPTLAPRRRCSSVQVPAATGPAEIAGIPHRRRDRSSSCAPARTSSRSWSTNTALR